MNTTISEVFNLTKIFSEKKCSKYIPDFNSFTTYSQAFKFIWLGHSSLLLNLDGKILLIDPVFSEECFPLDIQVDAILISHDHYDHLDHETIIQFKDKLTTFIVPKGMGNVLEDWGISRSKIIEPSCMEQLDFHGIRLTSAPAKTLADLCVSWIIEGKSKKIFYSGDTSFGAHFRKIGDEFGPFDVTFIENADSLGRWPEMHMRPEETLQAHVDLNGFILVPINWSTTDFSTKETHSMADDWDIPFYPPKLGQIEILEDCLRN